MCGSGIWSCRYYHLEGLVEEHALKEPDGRLLSKELKQLLAKEKDCGLGYGLLPYLAVEQYCNELEEDRLHYISRTAIAEILDRLTLIQAILSGDPNMSKGTSTSGFHTNGTLIAEAYEEYMEGSEGVVLRFWDKVKGILALTPDINRDRLGFIYVLW